jgi:hypothetical protein
MPAAPKLRFAGQFARDPENGTARPPSGDWAAGQFPGYRDGRRGCPPRSMTGVTSSRQVPARAGANPRGQLLAELVAPGAVGVAAGAGLVAEVHAAQRPRAGGPARRAGG